jgi:hypothetical protein
MPYGPSAARVNGDAQLEFDIERSRKKASTVTSPRKTLLAAIAVDDEAAASRRLKRQDLLERLRAARRYR